MATFVSEIIRCANDAEFNDLDKTIEELSKSLTQLKCEVAEEMENTYVNFLKMPSDNKKLVEEVKFKSDLMKQLQEKVDNMLSHELENSTGELHTLSTKLMEIGLVLHHVSRFVQLNEALIAACKLHEQEEYYQAAQHILRLEDLLEDSKSEANDLIIYHSIKSEVRLNHERLLYELKDIWKQGLRLEEPELDIEGCGLKKSISKKKKPHRACLVVETAFLNKLEGVFTALSALGSFDYHLSKFASNLMRLILQPLASFEGQVNVIQVPGLGNRALLDVETYPNKPQPPYTMVLQNLRKVFEFMRQYLILKVEQAERGGNMVTLVQRIGAMIGNQLCELLVTGCLAHTVPAYGHSLDTFQFAATEAMAFHQELKAIGFLPEENESLIKYATHIDVLFANKICELHLHTARETARKDLHDMMEVQIEIPEQQLPDKDDETGIQPLEKLSDYTFQFPKCQISKSAHELVELLRQLLKEAEEGSDVSSGRLLLTARQVVELYWAVSYTHHQQMLETIPQQVALFHNNCMYIAHNLIILGAEHQGQGCGVNFVDQVENLRRLGATTLLHFMQTSQQQLITTLRDSGLSTVGEGAALPAMTEKAIRQCLRQLELLKVVWSPVLPKDTYCRTLGCLLNALVQELVVRMVTLEDIPAHVATLLATIFSDVLERAPQVLPDPREVHRRAPKWHRLEALVKVLRISLAEIADLWADGAGPLARAFTANELKQLIRALFQNNKRRAAILAQIK